jgi:ribonuclease PH
MNVVMTTSGRFVEVQATAEQTPFEDTQMGRLLELARGGIRKLLEIQQDVLRHK